MNYCMFEFRLIHWWEPWCKSRKKCVESMELYFQLMQNWNSFMKKAHNWSVQIWELFQTFHICLRLFWDMQKSGLKTVIEYKRLENKNLKFDSEGGESSNDSKKWQFGWNFVWTMPIFVANSLNQFWYLIKSSVWNIFQMIIIKRIGQDLEELGFWDSFETLLFAVGRKVCNKIRLKTILNKVKCQTMSYITYWISVNYWLLLAVVGCCWLLLAVVGCCWLLLAVVSCCWLYSSGGYPANL